MKRLNRGRASGLKGALVRAFALGGFVALGLVLVACEEHDDGLGADLDQTEMPVNTIEFTVTDDGIEPSEQEVRVPDRYQIIVHNESSEDCLFDLSTYVRDLEVQAGEIGQIDVQLPPVEVDGAELEMGCRDDPARTGTLIVLNATGEDLGE